MNDQNNNNFNNYEPAPQQQENGSAGLICGIIGIFIAGLILGIIALALAKKDKNPTACRVLGIIDIVGWAFLMYLISTGKLNFGL